MIRTQKKRSKKNYIFGLLRAYLLWWTNVLGYRYKTEDPQYEPCTVWTSSPVNKATTFRFPFCRFKLKWSKHNDDFFFYLSFRLIHTRICGRPNMLANRFPAHMATAFIVPKKPRKFWGAISDMYNGHMPQK